MQIREQYPLNCGRDAFPLFCKKQRVPKEKKGVTEVRGPMDSAYQEDDYVNLDDLYVGAEVTIRMQTFRIYDADGFTRRHYESIGRVRNIFVSSSSSSMFCKKFVIELKNVNQSNEFFFSPWPRRSTCDYRKKRSRKPRLRHTLVSVLGTIPWAPSCASPRTRSRPRNR
jgi:hypothetical protein